MTRDEFIQSLKGDVPPPSAGLVLQALWYERKGDWHTAHARAQAQEEASGSWVHAYLHRVEGDLSNAAYWYRRAGKPEAKMSLVEEWESLVSAMTE